MSKNIRALSARQRNDKTLFEALTATAEQTGSPSAEQLRDLSKDRLVSGAALLGTISFYDFLRENNRGNGTFTNGERRIQRVQQVVPPLEGTRPDGQIMVDIMNRMG